MVALVVNGEHGTERIASQRGSESGSGHQLKVVIRKVSDLEVIYRPAKGFRVWHRTRDEPDLETIVIG